MSTKIRTGFQMRTRDMRQLLDQFAGIQKKAEAILSARAVSFISKLAAELVDSGTLAALPGYRAPETRRNGAPIHQAWAELDARQAQVRRLLVRDPDVDFELAFRLWLSLDTDTFIGYVRGEGADEFVELLVNEGIAERFAYWNSSDPDESISVDDWNRRGSIWKNAFAGGSGPWFDIQVEAPIWHRGVTPEVLAAIPTFEERVRKHAEQLSFNVWSEPFAKSLEESGSAPNVSNMLTHYLSFHNKLRNADGAVLEVFGPLETQVRGCLAPTITELMLTTGSNFTQATLNARR